MGQGTIQSNLGDGKYSITVDRSADLINEKISWLDEQIQLIENESNPSDAQLLRKTTLEKRKQNLQDLLINNAIELWCADYSLSQSGVVDTIEVNGEISHRLIAPASPGYHTIDSGDITPIIAQSVAQANHAWAIFPGWQKFKPTYRIGEITSIDYATDKCNIDLDDANSYINGIDINQSDTLSDVDIRYMSCNSKAFIVGDRVLIEFRLQSWSTPRVIGFEDNPQPCALVFPVVISNQDDSQAFAWDIYNNTLMVAVSTLENVLSDLSVMGYGDPLQTSYDETTETWQYNKDSTYSGEKDQGIYLSGVYLYLDWDRSDSRHRIAQTSYNAVDSEWERAWNYRYMEAPDFAKDAGLTESNYFKGLNLMILQRFPDYYDTDKMNEFIALSGGNTWDSPYYYVQFEQSLTPRERLQYFAHGLFDYPIDGVYIIKENLDVSCRQLIDNWSEVDGGGFSYVDQDPYAGYIGDVVGGQAETDEAAVMFECHQVCSHVPLDEDDCEDEDFYDRRLFNIYGHLKDHLEGVPQALLVAINAYRVSSGGDPMALNFGATKAAVRHAIDSADNGLPEGEIGSDGSTLQDRLEDAGYYFNVQTSLITISKAQIMEIGPGLTASQILTAWQADPIKDAKLKSSDYYEASISLVTAESGDDYVVMVLAGTPFRWPGYCPVDTTDIDLYMDANFNNKVDDYLKLPNVRILEPVES